MILLHLTAGQGPEECRLAVEGLVAVVVREAGEAGLASRIVESVEATRGLLSAVVSIEGEGSESFGASWTGTVLWTCPSPIRPGWPRKNWFVSVGLVRRPEPGAVGFRDADLRWETFRSSGAGGQHVNTTDSAVRLRHLPTGTVVECRTERSQHRNRSVALDKLAVVLAGAAEMREKAAAKSVRQRNVAISDRGGEASVRAYRGPRFERIR